MAKLVQGVGGSGRGVHSQVRRICCCMGMCLMLPLCAPDPCQEVHAARPAGGAQDCGPPGRGLVHPLQRAAAHERNVAPRRCGDGFQVAGPAQHCSAELQPPSLLL